MSPEENSSLSSDTNRGSWVKLALMGLAFVGVWAALVRKLTTDWSTNQQYEFGPFVPFFIGVLLMRRWSDRPFPQQPGPAAGFAAIGAGLFLLILPIRVIQEANPDWRPLNWLHAGVVVAICLLAMAWMGGRPWVKHFGVPLILIFFALPWPLATEQGVIQFLTRHVTSGTAEMLNMCGVPAFPRGNVIEVATGLVGVNEACSGIRSLAATLMAAAFFGEFYRLRWSWRVALIAGGVVVAFVLNLVRAFILGYLQAEHGTEAFERWHDETGVAIFAVSFAILWATAFWLSRWPEKAYVPGTSSLISPRQLFSKLPLAVPVAAIFWLILAECGTGAWYKARERGLPSATIWNMHWPRESETFRFVDIPDEVQSILRYSDAAAGMVRESDTPAWQVYFLRWDAGRTSAQLAVMHRPEICLPATGLRQIGDSGIVKVPAHGLLLSFHGSIFQNDNEQLYVYRCLWEDRANNGISRDNSLDTSVRGRLEAAWQGRRNTGQRLLQVVIFGAHDQQNAKEDLVRRMPGFVSVD